MHILRNSGKMVENFPTFVLYDKREENMERLTRVKAIRAKCIDCSENLADVRNCTFTDYALYPFRMGHKPKNGKTASQAIREHCLWCCCDSKKEVRLCPATECPIWRYRRGNEELL